MPNWVLTSYDPYMANITMIPPSKKTSTTSKEDDNGSDDSSSMYFRITSKGGIYIPVSTNGTQIGQTFKNPITFPIQVILMLLLGLTKVIVSFYPNLQSMFMIIQQIYWRMLWAIVNSYSIIGRVMGLAR